MQGKDIRARVRDRMITQMPLGTISLIEVLDNHRVLIENHKGIAAYGCNEIRVRVHDGYNCIMGSRLELNCISNEKVVIEGNVECIRFCRGKE
jgi:sporulation protein YqfC